PADEAERPVTQQARESAASAPPPAPAEVASEPEPEVVTGIVIGVDAAPVPGVELGVRGSKGVVMNEDGGGILWNEELDMTAPPLAVSGADGRFSLVSPKDFSGEIVSKDAHWETVLAPYVEGREPVLVVGERLRIAGRVIDESGTTLAGVGLSFVLPQDLRRRLGADLTDTMSPLWSSTTDEWGRFSFDRLPAVPGARM